ncbi:hypothetical protein CFC21_078005 [Triticum aestivum]|uniref:ATPase AAA-type core domain-containing protein n=2 Tax=Triticum aestivum TaxID=4565 RepID=A0A9R1L0D3_WHEAT|nr:hypothetical protein CFC21_078005 [Triticum aestivum]
MSEYADSGSVSCLIGGPRSYEEDGQLTEKVRSQPHSVVLFDEADKAHPSIFMFSFNSLMMACWLMGKDAT